MMNRNRIEWKSWKYIVRTYKEEKKKEKSLVVIHKLLTLLHLFTIVMYPFVCRMTVFSLFHWFFFSFFLIYFTFYVFLLFFFSLLLCISILLLRNLFTWFKKKVIMVWKKVKKSHIKMKRLSCYTIIIRQPFFLIFYEWSKIRWNIRSSSNFLLKLYKNTKGSISIKKKPYLET